MTAENSPWKATATTDPNAIGAAVVRTMALELAGQQGPRLVDFPGVLVTQQFLLDNTITNMVDLRATHAGLEPRRGAVSGLDSVGQFLIERTLTRSLGDTADDHSHRDARHHDVLRYQRGAEGD